MRICLLWKKEMPGPDEQQELLHLLPLRHPEEGLRDLSGIFLSYLLHQLSYDQVIKKGEEAHEGWWLPVSGHDTYRSRKYAETN